jgi:hypothetical protein
MQQFCQLLVQTLIVFLPLFTMFLSPIRETKLGRGNIYKGINITEVIAPHHTNVGFA